MVLLPGDPDARSVGSFFKNPVVTASMYQALAETVRSRGHDLPPPAYPLPGGALKVPAAWLIEQAGFRKGHRRGRAGISTRHTLALVNLGGATAREVLDLADEIQAGVRNAFGIRLAPEPVFVGFEAPSKHASVQSPSYGAVE
jgi:UDP-N-acetylmuramate dehydrogenase